MEISRQTAVPDRDKNSRRLTTRVHGMLLLFALVLPLVTQTALGEQPTDEQLAAGPEDWPQFLGPRRDGISHQQGLNFDWQNRPPQVLWRKPINKLSNSFAERLSSCRNNLLSSAVNFVRTVYFGFVGRHLHFTSSSSLLPPL